MGILALGSAVMLLILQVRSGMLPKEKKTPLWLACILSFIWPLTLILFVWSKGNLKDAVVEIKQYLKKPIS